MNGNSTGIVPTIDLATNNNGGFAYPYPVMGGFGNSGFGGFGSDSAIWLIVLLALIWGNNNGNGGFFGGNNGFDNGYAWLSNGQKDIMSNTNNGFDTLHLSNQVESVQSGINGLSNQLCNVGNDITSAINTTAYNAEIAAANRQMANMNTAFDLSRQFADCCCEFHWCLNNVAKGIARDELSYAMKQHNEYVRNMLVLMLSWYVGTRHDFQVSPGKEGKYFKKYLPEELYERFRKTYSDADYEHMWEAAFEMLYLFGDVARDVAEKLGFAYDEEEEQGIEKYMKMVRSGEI